MIGRTYLWGGTTLTIAVSSIGIVMIHWFLACLLWVVNGREVASLTRLFTVEAKCGSRCQLGMLCLWMGQWSIVGVKLQAESAGS